VLLANTFCHQTYTPALNYNADLIYMMANISNFVNVKWYFGQCPVPMFWLVPEQVFQVSRSITLKTSIWQLPRPGKRSLAITSLVFKLEMNPIYTLVTAIVLQYARFLRTDHQSSLMTPAVNNRTTRHPTTLRNSVDWSMRWLTILMSGIVVC